MSESSCLHVFDLEKLETSLSFSSITSYSLHFKEMLEDINRPVHKKIYISVVEHELFAQSNHRSMAKLMILAALLFFSSKTGVSSVGTTTSPQQQNPHTGTDKDPCEVLFKHALSTVIYYKIACTSWSVHLSHLSLTTHVCQAKRKTNPSSIISFQKQSGTLLN